MKLPVSWIIGHTRWLYPRIYENPLFFIDWWSLVHLWSGAIILAILLRWRVRNRWLVLFSVLLGYELVELLIPYLAFNIFRPETLKDQVTDICVGMLGGVLMERTLRYNWTQARRNTVRFWNLENQVAILSALTISFVWVGSYGYRYNVEGLNMPGVNCYVWAAWALELFVVIRIYRATSARWKGLHLVLSATWTASLMILFAFEYVSYHLFHVHEISKPIRTALLFDVIHGTTLMHWYYVTVPMLTVGAYVIMRRFFSGIAFQPLAAPFRQSVAAPRLQSRAPGAIS